MPSLARRPQGVLIPARRDRPPYYGKALTRSPVTPGFRYEVCEMSGLAAYRTFSNSLYSRLAGTSNLSDSSASEFDPSL